MSELKKCAACRKESHFSDMKVCMHSQMHYYVCDSKCMNAFYNPPKQPKNDYDALLSLNAELLEALEDIANDYAERFDMDSPSTNPGMKIGVENARAAIAKARSQS